MLTTFYVFLSLLLILSSYKSFHNGVRYIRFFKSKLDESDQQTNGYNPFVSVIVPCRGKDENMESNLCSLFNQNFSSYEIIFVVDSADDDAVSVIEKLRLENPQIKSTLVVAGKASGESQKIWNLRKAIQLVSEKSEVFVFADSDAQMQTDWLKSLVSPLRDETIGATTGYRWFIAKRFSLSSELCSIWNASVASALGENENSNFCWGGSTAIKRKTFEDCKIDKHWSGKLSDDFVVTNVLKSMRRRIVFVPQALTVSIVDMSIFEMLEFTTRQMKITRVYSPNLWLKCLLGSGLFNVVMLWSFLNLLILGISSSLWLFSLLTILTTSFLSTGKSTLRLKAIQMVLKDYKREINQQFLTHSLLWVFSPAIYFYNSLCAIVSRRIVWRGIEYELVSQSETLIIKRETAQVK